MTLGIDSELAPRTIDGGLLANAGEYVSEWPTVGMVIKHIIDCDQRYASGARMIFQPYEACPVSTAVKHGGGKANATWRDFTQAREQRGVSRHRDQFKPEGVCQKVVEMKSTGAFFGSQIAESQQAGEPSPSGAIAWIDEDIGRAVGEHEPRTGMITQRQVLFALCQMCAHHAGNGIAVAQAEPAETGMRGLHHQFLGMRSSAKKREVRGSGEFEITHTNTDFRACVGGLILMRMSRAGTMLARRRPLRGRGRVRSGTARNAGRSCPPRGNNRARDHRVR